MDPGLVVEACSHCNLRGCTRQLDHKYKGCLHNKASLRDLVRPNLIIKDKKSAREMAHLTWKMGVDVAAHRNLSLGS